MFVNLLGYIIDHGLGIPSGIVGSVTLTKCNVQRYLTGASPFLKLYYFRGKAWNGFVSFKLQILGCFRKWFRY